MKKEKRAREVGLTAHRDHHARGGPPYQQFFGYLDAFFFGKARGPRGVATLVG